MALLARIPGRHIRSFGILSILICALAALLPGIAGSQQSQAACFAETGYCIEGRIREVWEQSGGLAALGLPITPLQEEQIENQIRQVQWFERARLELHPENAWPYDVLLGRVGIERLARNVLDPRANSVTQQPPGECRTFETGYTVCGDLLAAWLSHGRDLDSDGLNSELESLALVGLPISEPRIERLSDGQEHLVQWFERARLELHPQNSWPYNVLFGLIARELSPVAAAPPGQLVPVDPATVASPPLAPGAAPARLVIWQIGLDRPIVPVGVDESGNFIVPNQDVGWYLFSAAPSQGENIVLWGHVLPFLYAPDVPAPFARLKELAVGARVTLYDGNGQSFEYAVTQQILARPEEVQYVAPQGREMVTMISCTGENVVVDGQVVDMSHRLITIAEPVATP